MKKIGGRAPALVVRMPDCEQTMYRECAVLRSVNFTTRGCQFPLAVQSCLPGRRARIESYVPDGPTVHVEHLISISSFGNTYENY